MACGLSAIQKPGQFPRPIVTYSNFVLVTNQNPAQPGQTYVLWLTGLGNPGYTDDVRSQFPTLRIELSRCCLPAYFDGLVGDASVLYAGAASGFPGLYQMNFTLRPFSSSGIGECTGCGSALQIEVWLSVVANAVSAGGGGNGSNYVSIPLYVSATANACQTTTVTNIMSSVNPSLVGQSVTFTATVAPTASTGSVTGSVMSSDGSAVLGTVALTGGVTTFSTSTLSAGTHSISATYSGDSNYGGLSATQMQTVKAATTTTLASRANPSISGQSLVFTPRFHRLEPQGPSRSLMEPAPLGLEHSVAV